MFPAGDLGALLTPESLNERETDVDIVNPYAAGG